jgi:phytoene dehydrogenase-like protein
VANAAGDGQSIALASNPRINRYIEPRVSAIQKAYVIGSGPNGLAAAIVLAQAGSRVEVLEAEAQPGGGVRTMELTLPAFRHDFGSAVHPLAAGSPFFKSLHLQTHGLQWIHSPSVVAHPLDDGTAVLLERDIAETGKVLSEDGLAWAHLVQPFAENWDAFARESLQAVPFIPRHPWMMAKFGALALQSARSIVGRFKSARTRALFAGLAAHSFLSLGERLSGAFGMMMAISGHAVGWPIPRGGAQSITDALCQMIALLGGTIKTSRRILNLSELGPYDAVLCDVTPRQLATIGGNKLSNGFKRRLHKYRYGPGVFKVDYALSAPIPWKAGDCSRAATVHLGGTFEEIAESETQVRSGRHAERPFVLLSQPSLFDSSRAPVGMHTAWAYCHVPNNSTMDMLPLLESQIERYAPGFRDCVLARKIFSPADLEKSDANLVGGDITGGAMDMGQFLFRPTWRRYGTPACDVYICSASTPPGGGVHGMCGYHAAKMALRKIHLE